MSESYRATGRGGAGNFYNPKDVDQDQKDIEAQQSTTPIDPSSLNKPTAEYAHQGRGGAGNWYSPADVPKEKPITPITNSPNTSRAAYSGRGGAGNFNAGDGAAREEERQQAEERQRLEEEVARDVEQGLQSPQRVHLAEGRSTEP